MKPQNLPSSVDLIIFVVGIHDGGTLADVVSGSVTLFDKCGPVVRLPLEQSHGSVDCMAVMKKSGNVWNFHKVDVAAERGHTFMDILEPTIGDVIRRHIPGAPDIVEIDFDVHLHKGRVVDLPSSPLYWPEKEMSVGVGWDFMLGAHYTHGVNLDVSAVFFNSSGQQRGAVSCSERDGFGAVHSGDNRDGKGAGDDECITVHLSSVPAEVAQIFFVVNIRTAGHDLSMVQGGFCRTTDNVGSEVARCNFAPDKGKCGKVFARLIRTSSTRWCQQALAEGCRGRTWMSALPAMRDLFHTQTVPPERCNHTPSVPPGSAKKGDTSEKRPTTARLRAAMIKRNMRRKSQCVHPAPVTQPTNHKDGPRARFLISL